MGMLFSSPPSPTTTIPIPHCNDDGWPNWSDVLIVYEKNQNETNGQEKDTLFETDCLNVLYMPKTKMKPNTEVWSTWLTAFVGWCQGQVHLVWCTLCKIPDAVTLLTSRFYLVKKGSILSFKAILWMDGGWWLWWELGVCCFVDCQLRTRYVASGIVQYLSTVFPLRIFPLTGDSDRECCCCCCKKKKPFQSSRCWDNFWIYRLRYC